MIRNPEICGEECESFASFPNPGR